MENDIMNITDLYKTVINCDKYTVEGFDDYIYVTVKLIDFNNNIVTGKRVTLSVDNGVIVKFGNVKNNLTNNPSPSTKQVSGNTNTEGEYYILW